MKLEAFKLRYGRVYCEACGEEDICALDVNCDNMQLAYMGKGHIIKISDLRVVCEIYHRKIHRHNITLEVLKKIY